MILTLDQTKTWLTGTLLPIWLEAAEFPTAAFIARRRTETAGAKAYLQSADFFFDFRCAQLRRTAIDGGPPRGYARPMADDFANSAMVSTVELYRHQCLPGGFDRTDWTSVGGLGETWASVHTLISLCAQLITHRECLTRVLRGPEDPPRESSLVRLTETIEASFKLYLAGIEAARSSQTARSS